LPPTPSPPPPPPTLFPYTTLFRSDTERAIQAAVRAEHPDERREDPPRAFPRDPDDERRDPRRTRRDLHVRQGAIEKEEQPDAQKDRKSTRLNSSHVSISYAVFCLK